MTVYADSRPAGVDVPFRPGNALTLELTWPTGELTGRTFASTLDGVALDLAVVGDVMTIEATEAETLAVTEPAAWLLTETTGATTNDLLVGTWSPSSRPGTANSLELTVAAGTVEVDVSVVSGQASILALQAGKVAKAGDTMTGSLTLSGGADLAVTGDATINGEILTGTFGSPATFRGIQREARVVGAGGLASPTGQFTFDNNCPRILLPPQVTTDVYMTFAIEEWWIDSTFGTYVEWSNDHTATGDIRWQFTLYEFHIATRLLSAPVTMGTKTVTQPTPAANGGVHTNTCFSVLAGDTINPTPDPFGAFYVLKMSRLGGDALDTLAGPIGLIEASYGRGV